MSTTAEERAEWLDCYPQPQRIVRLIADLEAAVRECDEAVSAKADAVALLREGQDARDAMGDTALDDAQLGVQRIVLAEQAIGAFLAKRGAP